MKNIRRAKGRKMREVKMAREDLSRRIAKIEEDQRDIKAFLVCLYHYGVGVELQEQSQQVIDKWWLSLKKKITRH